MSLINQLRNRNERLNEKAQELKQKAKALQDAVLTTENREVRVGQSSNREQSPENQPEERAREE